jgi:hypothetical protein
MTHDPDNHGWIELPANIIATNHHPQFMCYSRASILAPPNTPPLMLHMGVNENGVCFQDTRVADQPHGPNCVCWTTIGFEQWNIERLETEHPGKLIPFERLTSELDAAFDTMQVGYTVQHTVNQHSTALLKPPVA